jgi:hypothetical protein
VTDASDRDDEPAPAPPIASGRAPEVPDDAGPRPWIERIGLAGIAVVMSALFAVMAVAAWAGGEWILAAMSGVGAFVTIAVGLSTLVRG